MDQLTNLNVLSQELLPTPRQLRTELAMDDQARAVVSGGRQAIRDILDRKDTRFMVVVGPCSIHDPDAAREYAERLKELADAVSETMLLVMRVYFEKPRTTVGWKGLINDPYLDDSFHIEKGIPLARQLLLDLAHMGLPTGTEALDPIMPQYLGDLVSWTAIGARTTESQTHREMASGLSTPVGFKNGTDGSIDIAVNAIQSAANPHNFLGINLDGQSAVIRTRGNNYVHLVLRGGGGKPNYDSVSVTRAREQLAAAGQRTALVVDCSHANSNKDPALQPLVMRDCIEQRVNGNIDLVGVMIESNLEAGNQALTADPSQLRRGVSITDACIDWQTTRDVILQAHDELRKA